MDVVPCKKKITSKIFEDGKLEMMVGCAQKRKEGTYHMFILKTEKIMLTQDVKWLQLFYGD